MSFIDDKTKYIYRTVSRVIKDKKITAVNVMYITGIVMEVVEKEQSYTGKEKKKLVVNIIKEAVRMSDMAEDEKDLMYLSIDNLVPPAIDLIVTGASGKLNINIEKLSEMCGCFGAAKQPPEQTAARELVNKKLKKKTEEKIE